MKRTRLSLWYLFSYLTAGGLVMAASPGIAMKMLGSNADYGDVLPRMVGVLMLGLAIVVINVIRLGIEAFYPVTLMVRLFFMPCLVALYFYSRDPFFLAIAGIVGFGILLTGLTFLAERRQRARSDDR